MKVAQGSRVSVHYTLYANDPKGEMIEKTREGEPLEFTHSEDPMLPKFESALLGLSAGEKFTIAIEAADAYGEEDENLFVEFPKSEFMEDGELNEELFQIGEIIPMQTPEGDMLEGVVCEVKLNSIVLDFNHPLAGENLYFEGEVVEVK